MVVSAAFGVNGVLCYIAGIIPGTWNRYTIPDGLTVIQWITDFSLRIKQLQIVVETSNTSTSRDLRVRNCFFI